MDHARVLRVEGDARVQALVWRRENLASASGKPGPEQRIECDAVGFGYGAHAARSSDVARASGSRSPSGILKR